MKWIALLSVLMLAGCGVTGVQTAPGQVSVAVSQPCVDKIPERPKDTFGQGPYPGDAQAAKLLAADNEANKQHITKLETVVAGCVKLQP